MAIFETAKGVKLSKVFAGRDWDDAQDKAISYLRRKLIRDPKGRFVEIRQEPRTGL